MPSQQTPSGFVPLLDAGETSPEKPIWPNMLHYNEKIK
jgi:hypothetical protein